MISVDKDFDDIPVGLIEGKGWRHASVIKKLKEIYHGKCAYSEEKLGNSLHVMHYRPPGLYPELENEWSNLIPICPECLHALSEQYAKSESQKERPPSGKVQLLNPEKDTPENHLRIEPDGIMYGTTVRGQTTIRAFALNRSSLMENRKGWIADVREKFETIYKEFREIRKQLDENLVLNPYVHGKLIHNILFKKIFKQLKKDAEPQSEFSLLARNLLEDNFEFILSYYRLMFSPAA